MFSGTEIRIKLPQNIHQKWIKAASIRGLSLKGFISATVSAELIRTGELNPATESGVKVDNRATPDKLVTEVTAPTPTSKQDLDAVAAEWADDDDDADMPTIDLSGARYVPPLDASATLSDLDDEEDFYEPS